MKRLLLIALVDVYAMLAVALAYITWDLEQVDRGVMNSQNLAMITCLSIALGIVFRLFSRRFPPIVAYLYVRALIVLAGVLLCQGFIGPAMLAVVAGSPVLLWERGAFSYFERCWFVNNVLYFLVVNFHVRDHITRRQLNEAFGFLLILLTFCGFGSSDNVAPSNSSQPTKEETHQV